MLSWVQGEGTRVGETPPTDPLHLFCGGDPQPHRDCGGMKACRASGSEADRTVADVDHRFLGADVKSSLMLMVMDAGARGWEARGAVVPWWWLFLTSQPGMRQHP